MDRSPQLNLDSDFETNGKSIPLDHSRLACGNPALPKVIQPAFLTRIRSGNRLDRKGYGIYLSPSSGIEPEFPWIGMLIALL